MTDTFHITWGLIAPPMYWYSLHFLCSLIENRIQKAVVPFCSTEAYLAVLTPRYAPINITFYLCSLLLEFVDSLKKENEI